MLKLDLNRQADGNFEDVLVTVPGGQELRIRVVGIDSNKIRTRIDGPREIQVARLRRGGNDDEYLTIDELTNQVRYMGKNLAKPSAACTGAGNKGNRFLWAGYRYSCAAAGGLMALSGIRKKK